MIFSIHKKFTIYLELENLLHVSWSIKALQYNSIRYTIKTTVLLGHDLNLLVFVGGALLRVKLQIAEELAAILRQN